MALLTISLILIVAVLAALYFKFKNKQKPLIPELGDERNGVKTVTVNITMKELQDMSDADKLKSYVVRYLVYHPIPDEHRIDQMLILRYVAEATRLLRFSYVRQFDEQLICWYNPATFYREILTEVEKQEALDMRDAHVIPLT